MTRHRAGRGVPDLNRHTRPGPREQRTLLLLVWAGFLTTEHVREAADYTTVRRAQRRLRVWLDHGYTRVELQSGALHLPSIHVPTARAREFLMEQGLIDRDYTVARFPRPQKRGHALLVRSIFAVFAAADSKGSLRLSDFRFDHELGRVEPFRSAGLIPDALLEVQTPNGVGTTTYAVECDTGAETTTTLRDKFSRWRAVLDVWSPPGFLLVVVAEREGRRRTLARVMEEAGIGVVGVTLNIDGVRSLVQQLAADDPAVRVRRAERQGQGAEARVNERVVVTSPGAFRVLVEGRTLSRHGSSWPIRF